MFRSFAKRIAQSGWKLPSKFWRKFNLNFSRQFDICVCHFIVCSPDSPSGIVSKEDNVKLTGWSVNIPVIQIIKVLWFALKSENKVATMAHFRRQQHLNRHNTTYKPPFMRNRRVRRNSTLALWLTSTDRRIYLAPAPVQLLCKLPKWFVLKLPLFIFLLTRDVVHLSLNPLPNPILTRIHFAVRFIQSKQRLISRSTATVNWG